MIKILKWLITLMLLAGLLYLWVRHNNDMMKSEAKAFIYHDVDNIPPKRAALVLGTAKYLKSGNVNYFYTYRIDATDKLFKAGKIKAIVVSGDNGEEEYDEPTQMRDDLIARGIPKEYITLDYAGFRTLDSIVRAEAIFDLSDYIIVSQQFHLDRAIYIAHAKGQKVLAL
jgi:SanA protein